jgi:hypothetical protein
MITEEDVRRTAGPSEGRFQPLAEFGLAVISCLETGA